jgi:hypothetical protein
VRAKLERGDEGEAGCHWNVSLTGCGEDGDKGEERRGQAEWKEATGRKSKAKIASDNEYTPWNERRRSSRPDSVGEE